MNNWSTLAAAVCRHCLYHFLFVSADHRHGVDAGHHGVGLCDDRQTIWTLTRFWGKLFGINFALGVTTGITLEFQFGTNWAYYSHYVGDIFGAPLAIEGLMAFFLESTFIGLFFFGWDRLSRQQPPARHPADGAGHQPVGAVDPDRQRLDAEPGRRRVQLRDDAHGDDRLLGGRFNPDAQAKFVHTGLGRLRHRAMFVLSISAWYLLRGRDVEFAKRSFGIAAAFGFASIAR